MMMLVDKLRLPLPSKELVKTGFHWLKGNATLVVPNNTNCPLAAPLVAVRFKVVPLTPMPVTTAGGGATLVKVIPMMPFAVSSTRVPA